MDGISVKVTLVAEESGTTFMESPSFFYLCLNGNK